MNTEFPPLKVEACSDGLITLTDPIADGYGNEWSVRIHPTQLRWIAEQAGFVREMSASDADILAMERGRAADALRRVGRLGRRMRTLHQRIVQLDEWLWKQPNHEEADIILEVQYSGATMDLSAEFLKEFEEDDEPASRSVTQCHGESRQPAPVTRDDAVTDQGQTPDSHGCPAGQTRDSAASKASPKGGMGAGPKGGMGARSGNAASVTRALVERYPGAVNAVQALELEAMNTFRAFVRENAALLRVVAHWGDGECGALLEVLKAELLSRGTARGLPHDAEGAASGQTPDTGGLAENAVVSNDRVSSANRTGSGLKTHGKPMANPAGSHGKPDANPGVSGQLSLEDPS